MSNLANIDLNLLRALHVVLEEGSISRAAMRLNVTQPAMSKTIDRLRHVLDDPLFVRTARGVQPTPRSAGLAEPLRKIFGQIEECLTTAPFDPREVRGVIRIAASEHLALSVVPGLVAELVDRAPGLRVELKHLSEDYLDQLGSGMVDFVLHLKQSYPDNVKVTQLGSPDLRLWSRAGHPIASVGRIDLADITSYPLISFQSQHFTPDRLRKMRHNIFMAGLAMRSVLDTTHLLVALDTLVISDALMLGGGHIGDVPLLADTITSYPVDHISAFAPLRIEAVSMQHIRTANSALHRWFSEEISRHFL